MLDGMSDSIQRSRIENLHSTEVDRQSPTGLIFLNNIDHEFWQLRIPGAKIFTDQMPFITVRQMLKATMS